MSLLHWSSKQNHLTAFSRRLSLSKETLDVILPLITESNDFIYLYSESFVFTIIDIFLEIQDHFFIIKNI